MWDGGVQLTPMCCLGLTRTEGSFSFGGSGKHICFTLAGALHSNFSIDPSIGREAKKAEKEAQRAADIERFNNLGSAAPAAPGQ